MNEKTFQLKAKAYDLIAKLEVVEATRKGYMSQLHEVNKLIQESVARDDKTQLDKQPTKRIGKAMGKKDTDRGVREETESTV